MAHGLDTNLRFTGSSNPLTSNFTVGSDARLLVLGLVAAGSVSRSGDAPTYNGVAFTQADTTRAHGVNPEISCELWYLLEPGTGSALEVSIPNPTSLLLHVQVSSYNADTGFTFDIDLADGDSGTSASPSISLITTEDDAIIVCGFVDGEDFTHTGQTGV